GAVLEGHAGEWEELARLTRTDLDALADAIDEADATEVRGLDGLDPATLRGQARDLADHLASGGRTGGLLKAPAVRAARPLLDHVRVDGLVPDTPELLARLIRVLDAEVGLARIERRWGTRLPGAVRAAGGTANGRANGHARPQPRPDGQPSGQRHATAPARSAAPATAYSIRRARLVDAADALQGVLALAGPQAAAEAAAQAVPGLIPPLWSDAARVQELVRCLQALDAEREVAAITEAIQAAAGAYRAASLLRGTAPECAYAASALHARDLAAYSSAFAGIEEVADGKALTERRDALLARLRAGAPQLAAALERQPDDPAWDERLAELERAWDWARAEGWYRGMVNPAEERAIGERLRACDQRSLKLTGELGANLAWRHCLARMSHEQSQHLRAYQTAMRRYGKGTGKHAPTHLAAAQRHMEACQDAVPAWIMPTYRVAETIPPRPHAFDVVIVDEASQSGVDALFLLWLAPKVVVVGDDRQISPDNIGVDRYVVERLQRQHLPDVELRDLLGLDNSLYDQTASRYQGRIWLQEHFRCMPEIIEFSNQLSYGDHLLVPLRQFGTDRLEPLRTVHVANAITYGNDLGKINDDEAVAIVDRIARCCADPRYDGRSMGVVSLLGAAQAKRVHDLLVERIGPEEMVARRLKCGTAYDFQGDERSVMFLSMVVVANPDGRPLPALGGRGSEQRFNVAASRAQDQLWLFHRVQPHDLNRECVRWKLLSHCLNPPPAENLRQVAGEIDADALQEPFETLFEQQVCRRLTARGYRVVAQHRIHGFRVDLVVLGERSRLGLVCDGDQWRGPDQYDHDLARQRALERCGWRFHHLRASEFSRDPDGALEPLWQLLADRGISPADPPQAATVRL
ncbi:MAG TPA: AAA domain-containing protein, partial [Actinomycetota bacterium]